MKMSALLSSESYPTFIKLHPSSVPYTNVFVGSFEFESLCFILIYELNYTLEFKAKDLFSVVPSHFFIKLETSHHVVKLITHKVFT